MPEAIPVVLDGMSSIIIRKFGGHKEGANFHFHSDDAGISKAYSYSVGKHAEADMVPDIAEQYKSRIQENKDVDRLLIYSTYSPCDEDGHKCAGLLYGILQHIPNTQEIHVGYSYLYCGSRQEAQDKVTIKQRSLLALRQLNTSPKFYFYPNVGLVSNLNNLKSVQKN